MEAESLPHPLWTLYGLNEIPKCQQISNFEASKFLFYFYFFFQIIMNEFTFHSQTAHSTYLELERKNSSEGEPCRDQEVEWAERCHVARHTPLHPPPSFSSLSLQLHTLQMKWNEMLSTTSLSCYWLRFVHFSQSLSLSLFLGVSLGLRNCLWFKIWGTQV